MAERSRKLPAIQFYPGDWRKDVGVQSLSFHDRGVWFEMLMLMHESEMRGLLVLNGQVMSEDALCRILGLDKQTLTTTLTELLTSGVASRDTDTGAIMSRRMVRDESLRKVRAEAGKLGGNPVLVKQKQTTQDKQKPTPSSSVSSSSSKPKDSTSSSLPAWLTPEAWDSYQKVRKAKKSSFVDDSAKLKWIARMQRHFDEGRDVADMIDQMIASNWIGPVEEKWKMRPKEYRVATPEDNLWGEIGAASA